MAHILDPFLEHAEAHPDRPALIDEQNRRHTYRELAAWAGAVQHQLQAQGIGPGNRVLIAIPMSARLYASLLALFATGATTVFLDPWLSGRTMNRLIRRVQPDLMVATPKTRYLSLLMPARYRIPAVITPSDEPSEQNHKLTPHQIEEDATGLVSFTGGTSGEPGGIERTWRMLQAQLDALHPFVVRKKPRIGFTHYPVFGLLELAAGNTLLIPDFNLLKLKQMNGKQLANRFTRFDAYRITCSPLMLEKLIHQKPSILEMCPVEAVRCGGARVSTRLIEQTLSRLDPDDAFVLYGSSEAEPIAHSSFEDVREASARPLEGVFTGQPDPAAHVRVIQLTDAAVGPEMWEQIQRKNPEEPGELIVSGEHVAQSYFGDDGTRFSQNKIRDPEGRIWHRTGDIGVLRAEGIYLFGRKERAIRRQDRVYHPYPVEEYFERCYALTDTAYLEDQKGRICFCIGSGLDIPEATVERVFEDIGYPLDRIRFLDHALPRDPRHQSKLLDRRLRKWL